MTQQRIFPFFVNGQFWMEREVTEDDKWRGYISYYVASRLEAYNNPNNVFPSKTIKTKCIRFQLVEIQEYYPDNISDGSYKNFKNYMARWFTGFWVVDENIEICNGNLYFKENIKEKL